MSVGVKLSKDQTFKLIQSGGGGGGLGSFSVKLSKDQIFKLTQS